MSFIQNIFTKGKAKPLFGIHTELHSHLLEGIDDGVKTIDEAIFIIAEFEKMGISKIITTPHIMLDYYKNTPEIIANKLSELKIALKNQSINIQIEAAAEYYLDEGLMAKLEKEEPLLTFGDKYLLFEMSYINQSAYLTSAVFALKSQGYKPILAHPERYPYLYAGIEKFIELYELGVLFQLNINSLGGYYEKQAQKFAQKLIDLKMVDFIGSDCHGIRHLDALKKTIGTEYYKKVLGLDLLNDSL